MKGTSIPPAGASPSAPSAPTDTSAEAAEAQVAVMRLLTGAQRMELALQMSEEIGGVANDGDRARARHPSDR